MEPAGWEEVEAVEEGADMAADYGTAPSTIGTMTVARSFSLDGGRRHVVVIGAGAVGCATAIEALRAGLRVTLLEPEAPGGPQATSYGNAGWLSSHSVVPPALPGAWRKVPGWLADEEVTTLAGQARVFIMPSRMPEPYGLVAAEALMSGIPVIISSNALIAAEVERYDAGLVFRSGDAGSLAESLASTDDDRLMQRLCEGALGLGQRIAPSKAEWGRRMVDIYTGRCGLFAQ